MTDSNRLTDLVARLRGPRTEQGGHWPIPNLHDEAADAIEALMAALKPFADKADKAEGPFEPPYPVDYPLWRAARACLNGDDK